MALLQNLPRVPDTLRGRTVGRSFQAVFLLALVSVLLLGAFGLRLFQLQVVEGDRNRQLADTNRIRLVPKRPARGTIFDRNGKILAGSRLSHTISIWPIALPRDQWPMVINRLSKVLKVPPNEIQKRLEQAGYESIESITIARGISPAQATALAEYSNELPGVRLEAEAVRNYPNGDLAAHVIGYTGELTDEQLKARREQGYRLGDVVGQMGAESAFESTLHGAWGGQQVEVDSAGRIISILGDKPAVAGKDIQLTIDLELQRAAEAALGNREGAIVAIDPRNGAVLAMASWPTYDPNIFTTRITEAQWQQLQGADHPFLNRSLQAFPPASTFKIVTTAAALESGKYDPGTVLPTYPYIQVGGIRFGDWNRAGFGPLGFTGAMAWSSDTFFYQVAMRLGGPTLIEMTRRFGFGRKTGIELGAEESAGLVPDDAWKQDTLDTPWVIGDAINMSIGQGFLQATPLQVAGMFAVAANNGYRVTPHLLKDNEEHRNWKESLELSDVTIDILHQGLRRVITGGTAQALNVSHIPPFAGKTGTAEAPPGLSHAWFGAYAPLDNPEIVVVTFAEHHGGGGGAVAAPMALKVLEAYFGYEKPAQ
ncbi:MULTISPECIES: penicillin-binding protein 2 [Cyanophyceae]|uniref:penicillin-binding protein 2 n=1 Tax=Cyanophyceae TaxID=3028117 RepID=UPI0016879D83|nr:MULTISPECIES: penicillin-binding protein 2 [Cyanophyceae]MBD1914895.1 penicillin-binding protein 2 [Phormidium sp. FACHB-77]MBD2028573.1 penicillin-binding protein 2 [Phormidium sp. FACHB-322]MBD2051783.1 penicillin-binding protein 2 [Leptolyngbya sp. FACHB-60]